jgi:streptomycin 6-kinase
VTAARRSALPALEPSPALRRTVAELGEEARRWLAELPGLAARTAAEWALELDEQVEHEGHASVIVTATIRGGDRAILKLSVPHDDARHEAAALSRWGGEGAVRLIHRSDDGFVLLLERCDPGHDLWRVDLDEQLDVLTDLLPRLWVPCGDRAIPRLVDTCRRWEQEIPAKAAALGVPIGVASRAQRWAGELASAGPGYLLHGDLHPGNVLAAASGRWVAIDPKPWAGDPAFDLAQLLANWIRSGHTATATDVGHHADRLASRLSLDAPRILRWAAVKAIGWEFGRDEAVILDAAARSSC